MEQSAFHQLLLDLQSATEQQQRKQLEDVFYGFRNMNPSDRFVELLLNEIITESNTQKFAQILLQKDVQTNGASCCLQRLHDNTLGRNLMIQLMQYSTAAPSVFIGRTVGQFVLNEITHNREFDEALAFILQALHSTDGHVKEMGMEALQVLCLSTSLQNIKLPVMELLQQVLGDENIDVALATVKTLQAVLETNDSVETPLLPEEAQQAILMACLSRTGQAIQLGQEEKAELMLQSIAEIIDQLDDRVLSLIPNIIEFMESIINSNVIELLKFRAVMIVSDLCPVIGDSRKQGYDHVISFIRRMVIPNLGLTQEQIAEWNAGEAEFEYEDTSLKAGCEDLIEIASAALGKAPIYPLIQEAFANAANGDAQQAINALCLVAFSAESLADLFKKPELTWIVSKIIPFTQHPVARVRFEAAQTFSIFCSDLKEKLQDQHSNILAALQHLLADNEDQRTYSMAVTAICSVTESMRAQVLTKQASTLYNIAKAAFTKGMDAQTSAMMLISSLASGLDQDRAEPLIIDFMPGVFSRLESVMQAIQETETFTAVQTDFIHGLIECLDGAIDAVPQLFQQQLAPLMQCLQIIVKRTQATQEDKMFEMALDLASTLFSNFPEDATQHIDAMVTILVDVIRSPTVYTDTRPEAEGDLLADPNRDNMVASSMLALSNLIEDFPTHFSESIPALYKLMEDLIPIGPTQTIGRQEIYAQLIHIAQESGQNIQELHATIFPKVKTAVLGSPDSEGNYANRGDIPEYEMQLFNSMADLLFVYLRSYLKYCVGSNDLSTFQETVSQIMEMLHQVRLFSETKFARLFEAIESSNFDADERMAEFENLIDMFDGAMDNIGQAYSQFFLVLKEKLPGEILDKILVVVDALLAKGVESDPGVVVAIQAVSLLADIASFCTTDTANAVFGKYFQGLVAIAQQKREEWQLLQVIFFALQKYLSKTQNIQAAQNQEMLGLAVQLLDAALEDGEEHALNFYDNACNYLWIAGQLTGQGPDFWKALCKYCGKMENDGECIADGIYFFTAQLQTEPLFQQLKQEVVTVIAKLFFGPYHSDIKNEESNAQLIQDLTQLFKDAQARQIAQRATNVEELSRENFQKFFAK